MKNTRIVFTLLIASMLLSGAIGCSEKTKLPILDKEKIASNYFGEDADWYVQNIPFFECSDKAIEQVYYYRWKLYKAHTRNVGTDSYVITEFINDVTWDRDPYSTINAASMHHIYEGRWLKDQRYMNGYIDYLYKGGGNNRKYSESVADASYAHYLVNSDLPFIIAQLDSMKSIYKQWDDHWEEAKSLYYIPAMPDATEYTIASIDASGGKDGFEGGDAFRPTINSYMYGNAMAISHIAALKGDTATSNDYLQRANRLKSNIENNLWNDKLEHFTDRFKVDNQYVHYWDFIRGRELAGLIPWHFNLPADKPQFNRAWTHITDTTQLLGKYGFRTNEPSYQYYFTQFLFHEGKPGSQWNGPSWPYQTSLVLNAMANFINNYKQDVLTTTNYVHSLRLFAKQHFLPDGTIDLVENYDPNKGEPIVNYYWSKHYNHSSYNNLVITGLCGLRPTEGDHVVINPLVDNSIDYFCLDGVQYHGHDLTIVYDREGTKYNVGKGLIVFVDSKKQEPITIDGKNQYKIGSQIVKEIVPEQANLALNIWQKDYPMPSSSVAAAKDSLFQAIDGRIRYFSEITNGWSTLGSQSQHDWYAIDFGKPTTVSHIRIYPFVFGDNFALPDEVNIEYDKGGQWQQAKIDETKTDKLKANTANSIRIEKVNTSKIRINFTHKTKHVFFTEIQCYE